MSGVQNSDWFVSAVITDGSVRQSLTVVCNQLEQKLKFVRSIANAIGEKDAKAPDRITEIGLRIKQLESSLKFRLSILNPERKGAWFRQATATTGPFKESLLPEPVFSHYDETAHSKVATGLMKCWRTQSLVDYPLRATDPSLWRTLLVLNFELESIDSAVEGYPKLSQLPEELPKDLDSRALKAFLTNVKAEIVSHKSRLGDCYRLLLDASERYWRHHATEAAKKSNSQDHSPPFASRSESFKTHRTSTIPRPKPTIKTAPDLEALRYMGFGDFPELSDLKLRYHELARDMHPDKPSGSEIRFRMLNRSYRHLVRVLKV
jgi:hypothetical protein